jgi:hypothetical protein
VLAGALEANMKVLMIGLLMSGLLVGVSKCEPVPTDGPKAGSGGSAASPDETQCGRATCGEDETCCNESCGICTKPGEGCTKQLCLPDDADAGSPQGESCGPVTCDPGQVCCNESCGFCTEPDGFCTEQFCGPAEESPTCGGFAGIACPGGASCVDDSADDCDPNSGGADCGGTCQCLILALCVQGYVWDGSPAVCQCVPAADCQVEGVCIDGYVWDNTPGVCDCVPDLAACAAVSCLAGSECQVQDDGSAECVSSGPRCGGQLANSDCPGLGDCTDDPADGCDLDSDEDCSGVCTCEALAKCMADQVWDSSPEVCACVDGLSNACAAVLCPQGTRCEEQPVQCIRAPCPAQAVCVPL